MLLDEYMSLDATALAELVERKQVTAAELVALARRRADAVNPTLNAIIRRLDDVADRQAADPDLCGAFAGVPFLIKDLDQEYRGFPTTHGSRSLANDVADRHALVTQRFLDAGLVIFGMTNTPEFGAKGVTDPSPGSGSQPLEHRAHSRRVVGRIGGGGRGGHRSGRRGQRRWRIDPYPRRVQRARRPQGQPGAVALRPADRRADVRHGDPGRHLAHCARQRRPL